METPDKEGTFSYGDTIVVTMPNLDEYTFDGPASLMRNQHTLPNGDVVSFNYES
tara:strand:- start:478 stop:639 length:162 start_codon:yes stop_codon:yes gene_type:complete